MKDSGFLNRLSRFKSGRGHHFRGLQQVVSGVDPAIDLLGLVKSLGRLWENMRDVVQPH
jgi:hypothetical protein